MRIIIKHILLLINAIIHRDTSPKVVFYHDIGQKYTPMGSPDSLFWSHMTYLKREVEVKGGGGQRNVPNHEVAFDDGFRGVWDNRERLRKYDIHLIVFIAIALVGKPGYLTWDEIRTLQNDYGVDFQCHTWSHQTLIGPCNTDLPIPSDSNFRTDAWYQHELVDSKAELERQLNLGVGVGDRCRKVVASLCFPVGYFSDDVIRRCAEAGYAKLYASFPGNKDDAHSIVHIQPPSSVDGVAAKGDPPTPNDAACRIIPRCLCQFSSLLEFKFILNGGMNPLSNRYLKMHYFK